MHAFEIKELECAYADGNTVLHVPKLEISFGKVVVFLGPSGVGKSTLLETLGLMNNTIKNGEIRFADEKHDFRTLWNNENSEIPRIRSQHMSFVFQENNLLDNLTAMENAMIPLLIQGFADEEARSIISEWCHNLDLRFINEKTRVSELSVGQKQRLAFIRAAAPEFTVLFGDEPTGNLDEKNGDILMEALRSKIQGDKDSKLSIIVSHDIDLAVKYGDEIIVLTKNEDRLGSISVKNIFTKGENDTWTSPEKKMNKKELRNQIADLL